MRTVVGLTSRTSQTHCKLGNNAGLFNVLLFSAIVIVLEWFADHNNLGHLLFSADLSRSSVAPSLRCVCAALPRDQLSIKARGQRDVFLLDFFFFFAPFDVAVVVVCSAAVAVIAAHALLFFYLFRTHRTCKMHHFLCNQTICLRKKAPATVVKASAVKYQQFAGYRYNDESNLQL